MEGMPDISVIIGEVRKMMEDDSNMPMSSDGVDLPVGKIEERKVKTELRETPIRIYSPEGSGTFPAVLFFHGGGFIAGSYDFDASICRKMCKDANAVVISVDYALAPEYPFPTAVDEVYDVTKWVHKNASELNIQPDKIAIGGSSAGGNLAATVCYQALIKKEFSIVHLAMVYPPLNLSIDPAEKTKNIKIKTSILTPETSTLFNMAYLLDPKDALDPKASPEMIEDLKSMPSTSIFSAEIDPLSLEQERFAIKLKEAGIDVMYKFYPRIDHGFLEAQGLERYARNCKDIICAQLRTAFSQ